MKTNNLFCNAGENSKESNSQCPNWLDKFARSLEEQPQIKTASSKTAVEVVRERAYQPSIYEMMSSIVSAQKPKYSSVEEVVLDYQKQTGLAEHLKRTADSQLKAAAHEILVSASDDDDEDNEEESEDEEPDGDVVGNGRIIEFVIVQQPEEDSNEVRWDPTRDSLVAESLKTEAQIMIEVEQEDKPEILKNNPAIEHFITNVIDTNYGIQIPALLHSLIETFGRDGVDQQVFTDKDLLGYINNILMSKQHIQEETPTHIGRGVGTHVEYSGDHDSNKDPFMLLVPNK